MNKLVLTVPLLLAWFGFEAVLAQTGDYKLVWADEFNKDGRPDPKNWTFERGFVRNLELQYYQEGNAWCENGYLVIEGRRETKPNPDYKPGSKNWKENRAQIEYTASSLKTSGLHEWLYGRFEMRARIPTDHGLWPAFWTLGSARGWPAGGEVDIMEYYREMLLANLIWKGNSISSKTSLADLGGERWSREFHVWRMDWDRDRIRISVDDRLLTDADLNTTLNQDDEKKNPFREPHFLLLNLAIGGSQGGRPLTGSADPSTTRFPVRFEVDYVRVYQKSSLLKPL